jgi:hypothetical protein
MHIKGGKHFYVSISLYCLDVKVTENFNFEHRPKKIAHNLLSIWYLARTAGMWKAHTPTIGKENYESQEK